MNREEFANPKILPKMRKFFGKHPESPKGKMKNT